MVVRRANTAPPSVSQTYSSTSSFLFSYSDLGTTSSIALFLREIFTANAANPPVETAPATTNPMVAKQNGHIAYLLGQLDR
jgi:hypothetical protein